jgi:hypothetical protein
MASYELLPTYLSASDVTELNLHLSDLVEEGKLVFEVRKTNVMVYGMWESDLEKHFWSAKCCK